VSGVGAPGMALENEWFRPQLENVAAGRVPAALKGYQPKAVSAVNGIMNIVYNSENYYVVEYPVQHGYEVVDKQTSRGTYFQGDVAEKFRESMIGALGEDPSPDNVDEFLSSFGVLINFPMVVH